MWLQSYNEKIRVLGKTHEVIPLIFIYYSHQGLYSGTEWNSFCVLDFIRWSMWKGKTSFLSFNTSERPCVIEYFNVHLPIPHSVIWTATPWYLMETQVL